MRIAPAVLAVMLAGPGAADASVWSSPERGAAHAGRVPGELIVKFRAGVPAAERADALQGRGTRLARRLPIVRAAVARVQDGTVAEAAAALERDPRVAWAEPNVWREAGALPDDPLAGEQWGLHNAGQPVGGAAGAIDADIDAPEAWERTTGSPAVRVAVVDTGIAFTHPDLAANVGTNPGETGGGREGNGRDDDGNGFVDDWRGWDFVQPDNDPADNHGHGTHVAGILAARGDNGVGVTGVAWRAGVVPVRVLDNFARGSCAEIAAGMAYAVRLGVRVVNVSIGGSLPCRLERDVIESAPDTLFVVAAMNDGADVDEAPVYPCSFPSPNIVCVAATDAGDGLAGFSNHGARSVDLAAPGAAILSTYLNWDPQQTLFTEDFESAPAGRWVTGGSPDTWGRTIVYARSGSYGLSDSPFGGYADGTDNFVALAQGLDLRGRRDCVLSAWVRSALEPFDPGRPFEVQDHLIAETARDGLAWRDRGDVVVGSIPGFTRWLIDLSPLEGVAGGGLRFRLRTDSSVTDEGVALDDLEVVCVPPVEEYTGAREDFEFDEGTSMAAPQVSGVAVLLLSLYPELAAGELKQRLLAGVDPLPALDGRTVTGGRLNAARALEPPPAPPAPEPGAGAPPGGGSAEDAVATLLAADVARLARALARRQIRSLLRRRGFRASGLHALGPGRFTLVLELGGRRTIARGARSVGRPGRYSLAVRPTRAGRSLTGRRRRVEVELELGFEPPSGGRVTRRAALIVRRSHRPRRTR